VVTAHVIGPNVLTIDCRSRNLEYLVKVNEVKIEFSTKIRRRNLMKTRDSEIEILFYWWNCI